MSEIQLPTQKNKAAEIIAREHKRIRSAISPDIENNFQQFVAACVIECNRIDKTVEPESALIAMMNAAIIGLVPGASLGHCFFIPRKVYGKWRISLEVGYPGYLELSFRNGFLKSLHAEVILRDEERDFRYWTDSDGPQIQHNIGIARNRVKSQVVGAYCLYHTTAGGRGIRVMDRDELNIADPGTGPWKNERTGVEMLRKTPIRRAAKDWRKGTDLAHALRLEDMNDIGEEQPPLDGEFVGETAAPSLKKIGEPEEGEKSPPP